MHPAAYVSATPAAAKADACRVAVVIPAFRVAERIEGVLRGIPPFVADVIVVDDASPDSTSQVVAAVGDPRLRLVRHERNGGVGAAVITGYRIALELGAEVVVKMDGDGQMDPRQLEALLAPILSGEADYCKGSRFFHTRELARMPLLRRLGNLGLSLLAKASSGYWDVFDPTNGYTAVHRRALEQLDFESLDRRWFFETSMLLELYLIRAVVRDVPMPALYGDEQSALSEVHALVHFPSRLLRAFARRIWLQYFVREFSPVSLFLVVGTLLVTFGTAWGAYHWIRSAQLGVAASTGTVMIAVLPFILGFQLLLQALGLDIQSAPRRPLSRSVRG